MCPHGEYKFQCISKSQNNPCKRKKINKNIEVICVQKTQIHHMSDMSVARQAESLNKI